MRYYGTMWWFDGKGLGKRRCDGHAAMMQEKILIQRDVSSGSAHSRKVIINIGRTFGGAALVLQNDYAERVELSCVRSTVTSRTMVTSAGVGLLILLYSCRQTIK